MKTQPEYATLVDASSLATPEPGGCRTVDDWVRVRFPAYVRACVVALAFLVPLVVGPGVQDSVSLVKLTLIWWLGIVGIGLWTVWALQEQKGIPRFRGALPLAVFAVASLLSVVFSMAPAVSVLGSQSRYGGVIPLALYIAVMLLVVTVYWQQPDRLSSVVRAFTLASAILSSYILAQALGFDFLRWASPAGLPTYPIGTMGNSNFAGGFLAITLPFAVYAVMKSCTFPGKVCTVLLVAMQSLALWYTQTRGGLLAAVAAALVVGVLVPDWRRTFRSHLIRRVATIGVGIALCTGVVLAGSASPQAAGQVSPLASSRSATLTNRLAFWKAALEITWDHPLVGTGPDTFYATYLPHRSAAEARYSSLLLPDKPHNVFLERAASSGVIALAAYLAVIAIVLVGATRRLWRRRSDGDLLLVVLLASFVAYLIQGFFSIEEPGVAVVGWILIGSLIVLGDPILVTRRARQLAGAGAEPVNQATEGIGRRWRHRLIRYVAALSAAVLLVVGSVPLVAAAEATTDLGTAIRLDPLEPAYLARAGDLSASAGLAANVDAKKRGFFSVADRYYRRALDLQPDSLATVVNLARVNTAWGDSVDSSRLLTAGQWWRRALVLDRFDPGLHSVWDTAAGEMSRRADALNERGHGDPAGAVESYVGAARGYWAAGQPAKAHDAAVSALVIEPGNLGAEAVLAMVSADQRPR